MASKFSSKFIIIISITSLIAASLACARESKGQDGNTPTQTPLFVTVVSTVLVEVTTTQSQPEQPTLEPTQESVPVQPTVEPTQEPAPVQSTSDTTPPNIGNVNTTENRVYYGKRTCGVTKVGFEVRVTDDVAVESVWIQYRFNGAVTGGSVSNWKTVAFVKQDNSNIYTRILDAENEPKSVLNGSDGLMEYQIFARDLSGNTTERPSGSVSGIKVISCG